MLVARRPQTWLESGVGTLDKAEALTRQDVDMVAEGMPDLDCMRGAVASRWVGGSLEFDNSAGVADDPALHSQHNRVGRYSFDIGSQQAVGHMVGHAHLVVEHTQGAERSALRPQYPFVFSREVVDHTIEKECGGDHLEAHVVSVHMTVKRYDDGYLTVRVVLVRIAVMQCDDGHGGVPVVVFHMSVQEIVVQHVAVVDTLSHKAVGIVRDWGTLQCQRFERWFAVLRLKTYRRLSRDMKSMP